MNTKCYIHEISGMKPELVLTSAQKKRRFERHHKNLKYRGAIQNILKPNTNQKTCYGFKANTTKQSGETGCRLINRSDTPPKFGDRKNKRKIVSEFTTNHSKLPKHDKQSEGTSLLYSIY